MKRIIITGWGKRIAWFLHLLHSIRTTFIKCHYPHSKPHHESLSQFMRPQADPNFPYNQHLQAFLQGRKLLDSELECFPEPLLEQHVKYGYLHMETALVFEKGRPFCRRCGNHRPEHFSSYQCGRCGKDCAYCRECLTLGVVKACSCLVTWTGPPLERTKINKLNIRWEGQLTDHQQKAADELVNAVEVRQDYLVWAVTGAGKTEILYPAIKCAVERGDHVAIVSPRTDVVIELAKRIKTVFADVRVNVLYGDSPEKYAPSPITLATTHQLLRFYQHFDLAFVDEVDAFPFHNNPLLHHALEQALKSNAPRYFLTATPTSQMKNQLKKGELKGIRIPIRYHGHPLPDPTFRWVGDWKRQISRQGLPAILKKWVEQQFCSGRQAFLFIPSIDTLEDLLPILKHTHPEIEGVHAEDPLRHAKVEAFRSGSIPLLVTTTILERGVTIPFLDVAVLGADDPIFDERALVQISGRVGRDSRDPVGHLTFFHYGISRQMVKALQHIHYMNSFSKTDRR